MRSVFRIAVVFVALALPGCRENEETLRLQQQQYETVQEGAGGAVTGTVLAPGESMPSMMPPLTNTNADTTTAFTLPIATAVGDPAPPGTIAGTLPREPAPLTPRRTDLVPSQPRQAPAPVPAPVPEPAAPTETRPPAPDPQPESPAPPPREETPPSDEPPPREEPREDPPPPPSR